MNEWLPYKGTWKGEILEAIVVKGMKYWDEILRETGLSEDHLNVALSELYREGIIEKEPDGAYRVIYEIYYRYKRHYEGKPKPVEGVEKESKIVFVVCGRNEEARNALFSFLRSIELHPLEFSEAILKTGKGAPYIGEILDAAFSYAKAVIVLMTPDDEARLREPYRRPEDPVYEEQLTPQARPNVLFEAGMALSEFPTRTILIELGELRPFSDITGRHSIKLDNTVEKRQDLAQRLKNAGCEISLSGTEWRTAGNFEAAVPKVKPPKTEDARAGEKEPETQENVLLSDISDITRLGINNDFLNQSYKRAHAQARSRYRDAELHSLALWVYPFVSAIPKVTVDFYFCSLSAQRSCRFQTDETSRETRHLPPDGFIRKDHEKRIFRTLPWKKSPNWLEFLKQMYARISPLSQVDQTFYSLHVFPDSEGNTIWDLLFSDGFSGQEYTVGWTGKEIDDRNIWYA